MMLSNIPQVGGDPLWSLIEAFNQDIRKHKMDLIVGVYRDESGNTPIMQVVKSAEQTLANQGLSKAYRQLSGNDLFNKRIARFLLGDSQRLENYCAMQTVGGTGALRLLAEFINCLSPSATVWNSEPGYINHRPIMESAGLKVKPYRWQTKDQQLDLSSSLADLASAAEGDIILLHGCCHNPTGIDPTDSQWRQLTEFCKSKKLVPLIDMAYQGFGDEPDLDAAGLRCMAQELDLVLIASSCSKNMGLYCERVGVAIVLLPENENHSQNVRHLLERITRANYSMPPDHGAALAAKLFEDPTPWLKELSECRNRIKSIRMTLGKVLDEMGAPPSLTMIARQKGMFSMLPFNKDQMDALRVKFAIYGTSNGRINIAGLKTNQIRMLAEALVSIVRQP